jgi:dihydroxyacetone kinase
MSLGCWAGTSGAAAALAAAKAAAAGAEATAQMTARAGRTSYVPQDITKGVPDPGATAVAAWLAAVAKTLDAQS